MRRSREKRDANDSIRTTKLVVAWRRGKAFEFGLVDTSANLVTELSEIVYAFRDQLSNLTVAGAYSVEAPFESDEYRVARPDASAREMHRSITSVGGMQQVRAPFLRTKMLSFYAVIATDERGRSAAYLRHKNPMRLAKTGLRIFEFGDTLTRLSHDVFVIEETFDLVVRGDGIDVVNPKFYEFLFYESSGIDGLIDEWVGDALSQLGVEEETEALLVSLCRAKKNQRRKLMAIRENGHLANVNMGKFRRAVREQGYETRRFVRNGKIFAEEEDGEILLKILNQDLFRGCLDGESWEAGRKTRAQV